MSKPISLTGIKPTGTPHLGNYLGMIQPALQLVEDYQALYFIADYHALTKLHDKVLLKQYTYEIAATWVALGLDPQQVIFYRQSDVPEIFELAWVLSCFTAKGLLNRAHAYKAAIDDNTQYNRPSDDGVNAGLFQYPVLMASDILLFGTQVVPVGYDQTQHLEIARDIALSFNTAYGNVLEIPRALVRETVQTIAGIDGRKMSKSYDNVIPLFADSKQIRKRVMSIVTDSKRPEDPKNPDECHVLAIYQHFANPAEIEMLRMRYIQGGLAYGEIKQDLFDRLESHFAPARETYNRLMEDVRQIEEILEQGAEQARSMAHENLQKIRSAIGVKVR